MYISISHLWNVPLCCQRRKLAAAVRTGHPVIMLRSLHWYAADVFATSHSLRNVPCMHMAA